MEEEPIKQKRIKCKCYRCPQDFLKNGKELKQCIRCRNFCLKYATEKRLEKKNNEQIYYKGIGSQQQSFDNGDAIGHNCFIVQQQNLGGKWSNTYTSFTCIQSFLDYQENIDPENRRFYEIIRK